MFPPDPPAALLVPYLADAEGLHCFEVQGTYNPETKALTAVPAEFKASEAMEVRSLVLVLLTPEQVMQ